MPSKDLNIELPLVVIGDRGGSRPRRFTRVYNGATDKPRADAIQKHLQAKFPALKTREHFIANGLRVCNDSADEEEYVVLPESLPKGYDWKGCSGAMEGLAEIEGRPHRELGQDRLRMGRELGAGLSTGFPASSGRA